MEDRRIQASYLQIDKGIFTNNITASGITFSAVTGSFTVSTTGTYGITALLICESTSSPEQIVFKIQKI